MAFHNRCSPLISAYARRAGFSDSEIDKVIQGTMIKVSRHIPSFKYDPSVCRLRTWLSRIVNQRIIEVRHQRKKSLYPLETLVHLRNTLVPETLVADSSPAASEAITALTECCLARVRSQAKVLHWQVFESHHLLGSPAAEVGRRFDVSSGNVRIITFRFKWMLRREWNRMQKEGLFGETSPNDP
ncbi:MAG: sigma-70 family RNA polymerase sigma factor [Verrucomicrobia bacterium]|nr:sigma-70 family RNA polymerase sigma factor [Verrucomicrobiota bacterium]